MSIKTCVSKISAGAAKWSDAWFYAKEKCASAYEEIFDREAELCAYEKDRRERPFTVSLSEKHMPFFRMSSEEELALEENIARAKEHLEHAKLLAKDGRVETGMHDELKHVSQRLAAAKEITEPYDKVLGVLHEGENALAQAAATTAGFVAFSIPGAVAAFGLTDLTMNIDDTVTMDKPPSFGLSEAAGIAASATSRGLAFPILGRLGEVGGRLGEKLIPVARNLPQVSGNFRYVNTAPVFRGAVATAPMAGFMGGFSAAQVALAGGSAADVAKASGLGVFSMYLMSGVGGALSLRERLYMLKPQTPADGLARADLGVADNSFQRLEPLAGVVRRIPEALPPPKAAAGPRTVDSVPLTDSVPAWAMGSGGSLLRYAAASPKPRSPSAYAPAYLTLHLPGSPAGMRGPEVLRAIEFDGGDDPIPPPVRGSRRFFEVEIANFISSGDTSVLQRIREVAMENDDSMRNLADALLENGNNGEVERVLFELSRLGEKLDFLAGTRERRLVWVDASSTLALRGIKVAVSPLAAIAIEQARGKITNEPNAFDRLVDLAQARPQVIEREDRTPEGITSAARHVIGRLASAGFAPALDVLADRFFDSKWAREIFESIANDPNSPIRENVAVFVKSSTVAALKVAARSDPASIQQLLQIAEDPSFDEPEQTEAKRALGELNVNEYAFPTDPNVIIALGGAARYQNERAQLFLRSAQPDGIVSRLVTLLADDPDSPDIAELVEALTAMLDHGNINALKAIDISELVRNGSNVVLAGFHPSHLEQAGKAERTSAIRVLVISALKGKNAAAGLALYDLRKSGSEAAAEVITTNEISYATFYDDIDPKDSSSVQTAVEFAYAGDECAIAKLRSKLGSDDVRTALAYDASIGRKAALKLIAEFETRDPEAVENIITIAEEFLSDSPEPDLEPLRALADEGDPIAERILAAYGVSEGIVKRGNDGGEIPDPFAWGGGRPKGGQTN